MNFDKRLPIPLLLQTIALLIYAGLGYYRFAFVRMPYAFIACLGTGILAELIFLYFEKKPLSIPLGSVIAAISTFLLIESYELWIYILAVLICVISKRLFTYRGTHFFNPSNIAIIVLYSFFPNDVIAVAAQWGDAAYVLTIVMSLGLVVCYLAGRIPVAAAYILSYLLAASVRGLATNTSIVFFAGTLLGTPQILFTFHMITDPKTSPSRPKEQIIFGAAIGLLDAFFRYQAVFLAPFQALCIICSAIPIVSLLRQGNLKNLKRQLE